MIKKEVTVVLAVVALFVISSFSTGIQMSAERPNTEEEDLVDGSLVETILYKNELPADISSKEEIEVLEEYESFYVVRAKSSSLKQLGEGGASLKRLDDRITTSKGRVELSTIKNIDIRTGEDEDALYLIQFIGPIKQRWKEQLQDRGLVLLERVGDRTYLTYGMSHTIHELKDKDHVKSISPYHSDLKIDKGLQNGLKDRAQRKIDVKTRITKDKDLRAFGRRVDDLGGKVRSYNNGGLRYDTLVLTLRGEQVSKLARDPSVVSISEDRSYHLFNDVSSWTTQSYEAEDRSTPVWDHGLTGENQLIGIADTGLDYDHAMFRNKTDEVGEPGEHHRKVNMYYNFSDGKDTDYSGHGTHVSGSAAGDWKNYGAPDDYDGMAPSAKINFYDIGGDNDSLNVPSDISDIFQRQYDEGARVFSNSWGTSSSDYTTEAESVDEFMWNNNDALILFANGNSGPSNNTVASPATAKNLVSVGNAINGVSEDIAESSSKGPTDQGRLKPTVSAPGSRIISSDSDGDQTTMNDEFIHMTGTSMATPITAGGTALIRQYYSEGWHLDGVKDTAEGFAPSGSLMKATLINSAWNMEGRYTGGDMPANGQGWGKINLDDTLYFEDDPRKLDVLNDGSTGGFSNSGESHTHSFYSGTDEDLKLTLAWTDYPGSALQNDLNLLLEGPDGKQYKGNVFSDGLSDTGGEYDDNNVSEQVLIPSSRLKEGEYTVKVIGETISNGPQRYSLIATGDLVRPKASIRTEKEKYNVPPVDKRVRFEVLDSNANSGTNSIDQVNVMTFSDTDSDGVEISVDESGEDTGIFTGEIILSSDSTGDLTVSDNDTVTIIYEDPDRSSSCIKNVAIDIQGPEVAELKEPSARSDTLTPTAAKIRWKTDEEASSKIIYGKNRELEEVSWDENMSINHSVILDELSPNTTYYYKIVNVDDVDSPNLKEDDNGGAYYTFRTPEWPVGMGTGYSGYAYSVSSNEKGIFDRGYITCGYYYTMGFFGPKEGPFYGTIMFDTSEIDVDDLASAELELSTQSNHKPSIENHEWSFEVLTGSSENIFPEPSYNDIEGASTLFNIGNVSGSQLGSALDKVNVEVPDSKLSDLKQNMQDGRVVVRMRMDTPVDYLNMVGWYSGHHGSKEEEMKGPKLVLKEEEDNSAELDLDRDYYSLEDYAHVRLKDADLNTDSEKEEYVEVDVSSESETETLRLTELDKNSPLFKGSIELSSGNGSESGVLSVESDDEITVEYLESDPQRTITESAKIDSVSPQVNDVTADPEVDLTTTINWTTDEPTRSVIRYGGSDVLTSEEIEDGFSTEHSVKLSNLVKGKDYYYRIIATDKAGNKALSPEGGSLRSFSTPSDDIQPSIMVIDDDAKEGNYLTALDNDGLKYDFESVGDTEIPSSSLNGYDITIWITDGFSDTLTVDEQMIIEDYLDNGGRLYLNGEDIGYDIGGTSFYEEYLHAVYRNDTSDSSIIDGITGDPISDGYQDLELGGKYPDEIDPADEQTNVVFNYDNGKNAGLKTDVEDYRLVYLGFEFFEGPAGQSVKDSMMSDIIDWLDPHDRDMVGTKVGISYLSEKNPSWNSTVTIEGVADELTASGSNISEVEYFVDILGEEGSGRNAQLQDDSFDSLFEKFNISIDAVNLSEGKQQIYFRARDEEGNWGKPEKVELNVQDTNKILTQNITLSSGGLTEGWNFVSTKLEPKDKGIDVLLNDPDTGISGKYDKVLYFDAEDDRWSSYIPNRSSQFNDDIIIDHRKGFWIRTTDDCDLTVEGYGPSETTIELRPGWNMVGYPSNDERTASSSLPNEVSKIGLQNGTAEYNVEYYTDLTTVTLRPGDGYWVYNGADEKVQWTVEY